MEQARLNVNHAQSNILFFIIFERREKVEFEKLLLSLNSVTNSIFFFSFIMRFEHACMRAVFNMQDTGVIFVQSM